MSLVKNPGRNRTNTCDVIRELIGGPKTVSQLCDLVPMSRNGLTGLLGVIEQCGLVMIERRLIGGYIHNVYHWCPVPFEVPPTMKRKAEETA